MTEVLPVQLTREQARERTEDAKRDMTMLWLKLYALHEGGAHHVLGYANWGTYYAEEFGGSATRGRELLGAGQVVALLERENAIAFLPANEAVARELGPVMRKVPDRLVEVWTEALASAEGDTPTAAETRAVVDRRTPEVRPPQGLAEGEEEEQEAPSRAVLRDRAGLANPISNALSAAQSAEMGAYMALRTDPPAADLMAWLEELKQARRTLSRVRAKIMEHRRRHARR